MNGQRLRYAVPAAVTGLAWVLVLAGCTTSSPAPPTGSTTGVVATTNASPSTSSGSPSASSSGSTTRPPYPTDVPADALANTPQGAEAFVRYFLQTLNRGYTVPEPGAVARLSTATCKSCAGYEDRFDELVANQRRLDRQPFVLTEVMLVGDTATGAVYSVDAVVNQQAVRIIDSTGATHQTWTAKAGILVVDLVRADGYWLVNGVRVRQ